MKVSTPTVALLGLALFVAGYATRCATAGSTAAIAAAADTLDADAAVLDSSIDRRRPIDSAAVAEPVRAAGVHLQHAGSLGDSVTLLTDATNAAIAEAAASDTARVRAEAALALERATRERQADALRAGAQRLQEAVDSAKAVNQRLEGHLASMRQQRDKARALLRKALTVSSRGRCGLGGTLGYVASPAGHGPGAAIGWSCQL